MLPDIGQALGVIALITFGWIAAWLWHRRSGAAARAPALHSQLTELRAIGELSVFRAVSKDILTHVDHTFGEFGRKYLSWAFSKKKLAMIFEFEMDFRFDLRSDRFEVKVLKDAAGSSTAVITMPPCQVDVAIRNLSFYDEQRAKFLPWLLPDLLQGFFDGRMQEEDKNRLITAARDHARLQAQDLARRYRTQVEQSAYSTLRFITHSLGVERIELRFMGPDEEADALRVRNITEAPLEPTLAQPMVEPASMVPRRD